MEAPDFWNDPEVSQNKMKEVKSLKDDVATYAALSTQYDDIETMIEMGYEENGFKEMCCIQIRKDKNAKNTIHRISKVLQCNKCIRTINDSD